MKKLPFAAVEDGKGGREPVSLEFSKGSANVLVDTITPRSPYPGGYGYAIPTRFRVRVGNKRWRRVYCTCYGNVGTCWVQIRGERYIVDVGQPGEPHTNK
jgi:hypothetical protein